MMAQRVDLPDGQHSITAPARTITNRESMIFSQVR